MGTVPDGDYEYDLAHDVPQQVRGPAEDRPQHECAPPVHGDPDGGLDLGTDYGYDEVHGG
jgi:hypothetical protein